MTIEGQENRNDDRGDMTVVNTIDLDFLTGRWHPADARPRLQCGRSRWSLPVAIVNETMAARYWPNQDPIGKRVRFTGDDVTRQVVGVARTANYASVGETPQLCVYLALAQNFTERHGALRADRGGRSRAGAGHGAARDSVARPADRGATRARSSAVLGQAMFGATIGAGMLSVFGLLALGLASLGLYGVMAYSVSARRREIGVRMALGANHTGVMRLVLRERHDAGRRLEPVMGLAVTAARRQRDLADVVWHQPLRSVERGDRLGGVVPRGGRARVLSAGAPCEAPGSADRAARRLIAGRSLSGRGHDRPCKKSASARSLFLRKHARSGGADAAPPHFILPRA